jgi:putative nucleotidyltransferase with HDIG domain
LDETVLEANSVQVWPEVANFPYRRSRGKVELEKGADWEPKAAMNEAKAPTQMIREAICRKIHDIPPLPAVVGQLLAELQSDETTTAARLESLILKDPALAAKTLRVVNSAYYGLSRKVMSIGQAVVILGTYQLRNLLMSLAAVSLLQARTPRQKSLQKAFWEHSLATALCAEAICRKKGLPQKEIDFAFVGGLLHEVGRLFLFTHLPDTYQKVAEYAAANGHRLSSVESSVLGISHDEVGLELARIWNFPEALEDFIGRHDGPFTDPTTYPLLAVHAAHIKIEPLYRPNSPDVPLDPLAQDWIGFEEMDWILLRDETSKRISGQLEVLAAAA